MAEDALRKLEMKVVELEDQLKKLGARPKAADLTPDDIQAFLKVRQALGDWGEFCGPSDCQACRVCHQCVVACVRCQVCIFECGGCGPCACSRFTGGGSGAERFSGLGG
jgi:hypothetical protein